MEPIPVFYDQVSRSAVAVTPKKPLRDWIDALLPEYPQPEGQGTVYLIKALDGDADIEKWLKTNYKNIFENELNQLYTDEDEWPKNRSFKLFNEWFDFTVHPFVVDMLNGPVKKY